MIRTSWLSKFEEIPLRLAIDEKTNSEYLDKDLDSSKMRKSTPK